MTASVRQLRFWLVPAKRVVSSAVLVHFAAPPQRADTCLLTIQSVIAPLWQSHGVHSDAFASLTIPHHIVHTAHMGLVGEMGPAVEVDFLFRQCCCGQWRLSEVQSRVR